MCYMNFVCNGPFLFFNSVLFLQQRSLDLILNLPELPSRHHLATWAQVLLAVCINCTCHFKLQSFRPPREDWFASG